jgi:hypothetical protein
VWKSGKEESGKEVSSKHFQMRFGSVPERKEGRRPAATSVAGSIRKFAVGIPAICVCNPPRKIHADQSHFYHMEHHTGREIPVLL